MPFNHAIIGIFSERGDYVPKKSLFSKFYGGSDFENIAEKQATALGLGMTGGLTLGIVNVLFKPELTLKEILANRKAWTVLQMVKGTLVGGISACTYVGTTHYLSSYRKKDDWVNHFIGGYVGLLPISILYRKDWKYLIMGGTIVGVLCALAKIAGNSEFILPAMQHRQDRLGQTKYPEIYVWQQTLRDMRKLKAAELDK